MDNLQTKAPSRSETSLGEDVYQLLKHWLRGRRGWLVIGSAVIGGGLWMGWPALVAAGVAPLLLSVLPCVAMCALGLCMKGGGKSCESARDSAEPDLVDSADSPPQIQANEESADKVTK